MLVVSARSEDIDKIRGLEYEADDYLTKTFSPTELGGQDKSHIKSPKPNWNRSGKRWSVLPLNVLISSGSSNHALEVSWYSFIPTGLKKTNHRYGRDTVKIAA